MQESTTPTATLQLTHIDGTYYPGVTVYGALAARLELKGDRLILTTVEGTAEAPINKEIFNCALSEVQKIRSMLDEIRITVDGKSYRMSVAQYAGPVMASGGVAGTAVAAGMYKKSGADVFLQTLRNKGVTISRIGYGKVFGIAVIIAVVLIAILAGIFLLTEQ